MESNEELVGEFGHQKDFILDFSENLCLFLRLKLLRDGDKLGNLLDSHCLILPYCLVHFRESSRSKKSEVGEFISSNKLLPLEADIWSHLGEESTTWKREKLEIEIISRKIRFVVK